MLANKDQVMATYKDHEDDGNGDTFTMAIFIRSIELCSDDEAQDSVYRLFLVLKDGKQCIVVMALPNATNGELDIMVQVLLDTGSDGDIITKNCYNKYLVNNKNALLGMREVNKNLVVANGSDFRCEK